MDLIDRQAAIDAVKAPATIWIEYDDGMSNHEIAHRALEAAKETMIRIMTELPSVTSEIVRCGDCKNWVGGYIENDSFVSPRCNLFARAMSFDDFCSRAERREE